MENKSLVPGQLVGSTAGRDAGKLFLVVGVMGDSMIQVADGKGRKIERPKKKNIKHLKRFTPVAMDIADRLKEGNKLTDADIRAALEALTGAQEDDQMSSARVDL